MHFRIRFSPRLNPSCQPPATRAPQQGRSHALGAVVGPIIGMRLCDHLWSA